MQMCICTSKKPIAYMSPGRGPPMRSATKA